MRSVKTINEYYEGEVKPSELIQKYIELTQSDIASRLLGNDAHVKTDCPGCGSANAQPAFERFGLPYVECGDCRTLWVNPRPDEKTLDAYYANSDAENYWRDELSKATKSVRRDKIITPRIDWIIDSTQQYYPQASHIAVIKAHQEGYGEAISDLDRFGRKTLLKPIAMDECPGVEIVKGDLDEGSLDVAALFESLDRASDVDGLMNSVSKALKPGGLCFLTNILASGFDVQVLWDRSDSILPPDRLNMFSVEGLKSLFARHGFECLEFSTPGQFDVEIVARALKADPALPVPKFISYLLNNRASDDLGRFQEFLQSSLLSSYGRALIRKC